MCQISVVIERDGEQENILDNVTGLEVKPAGIELTTLFEQPRTITDAVIRRIDFLGGKVVLQAKSSAKGEE